MSAEVEVKYKIAERDLAKVCAKLHLLGFSPTGFEELHDYFLKVEKAEKGWNFTRLRADGRHWLTVKNWIVDKQGNRVRIETETELNLRQFVAMKRHALFGYRKTRHNFTGKAIGKKATVSLDTVWVKDRNHHFLEVEVMGNAGNSESLRRKLLSWAKANLGLVKEAPSMLDFLIAHEKNFKVLQR